MNKILTRLSITAAILLSYGMSSPFEDNTVQQTKTLSGKYERAYTKPHAGIELKYNSPKNLQIGEAFELVLDLKTTVNADSLQIKIKHDDGLQLGVSQLQYEFTVAKNQTDQIVIPLTALRDGRFFIDISAVLITGGQAQARAFSIPFIVGDPAKAKAATGVETGSGYKAIPSQGVISMPATETDK